MKTVFRIAAAGGVVAVLAAGILAAERDSSPLDVATNPAPTMALATDSHDAPAPAADTSAAAAEVVVYKSPTCGCCSKWVDHIRANGFTVVAHDTADVVPIKRRLGLPAGMESCHTAVVGGYVVEGHVPAADLKRLLAERPEIVGIAVPGMPMGSPGMEGPRTDRYDVVSFDRAGRRAVFASH